MNLPDFTRDGIHNKFVFIGIVILFIGLMLFTKIPVGHCLLILIGLVVLYGILLLIQAFISA
jgi:hypothetical protein